MFPVMSFVMGYAVTSASEKAQKATLLIVDNDGGNWSQTFIDYLNSTMNVQILTGIPAPQVINQNLLADYNSTQFMEIPAGF
jgi:Ni2+-binding GTPase involved in maturation of urease and hydrogenase